MATATPPLISLMILMILGKIVGCIPCESKAQKFATTEYGYVYHRVRLRLPPSTVTFLKKNKHFYKRYKNNNVTN